MGTFDAFPSEPFPLGRGAAFSALRLSVPVLKMSREN